jgi:hypothetical protein
LSIVAVPSLAAPASDWQPSLVTPPTGGFGPSETIRITLPKLPAGTLQHLALELDDIDVTGLVSVQGNQAAVTPTQPLAWGQHQLRMVEYAADGGIVERGAWTLDVRKSTYFREAELKSNVTLNATNRVSDNHLVNPPGHAQSNGAAHVQGAVADDGWRVSGNADLLYNSQEKLLPRQKQQTDLGTFLVTGNAGPLTVNAGHHAIAPDSLVMQGFNRRGASATLASPDTGASITGFELRTQDITGAQQGLGVRDSENRVSGVTATARPIGSDRDALLVSATYLSGQGPNQVGVASGGDPTAIGGRAASLSADGSLLDKRVRLRGEYAATRFDFDGLNSGYPTQSDHAYAALAQFTPWRDKIVGGQPMAVSVGAENKRIGSFFHSPANPTGVADRQATRGFAAFNWSGLNAQLSLGHETDNVDDLALLPRTETTQGIVSLNYTPLQKPGADGQFPSPAWYGQPTYNMTYVNVDMGVEKAGGTLSSGALHATRNLALSASFSYPTWNWSVAHTRGQDEDLKDFGPDTENRLTQLTANLRLGDKLTLGPTAQINRITNKSNNNLDSDTTTMGMNLGYLFTQRISANLSHNLNHQRVKDGSTDIQTRDTVGNLSWMVQPAQDMKPGITLALEGLYHDADDRVTASNNVNNYQLFLKAAVSWQPGY